MNSPVLIVTGASRGIGAATVRLAANKGYSICVNYHRSLAAAESLVTELRSLGVNAIAASADMANEQEIVGLFERVDNELGPVTALVCNAGILETQQRVDQMDADRVNRILSTNVTSYFVCCREAVKRMSTRYGGAGGSIVNVSSAASRLGAPNEYVDYAASKGAIDSLTIGLSKEVAEEGIRVNAVRPAFIHTDIHASGGEPNRIERLRSAIPMKRGGQPEEVAHAILWLLSDQASYVTGTFVELAGGR